MNAVPHPAQVERAMSAAQSLIASLDISHDDEVLLATLEGETDVFEVARRLVRAALDAETLAEAVGRRVDDLNVRRDRFKAQADRARETVKQMLDALGLPKLVAEDFTVSLRMGPGKVHVIEPEALPEEFWRTVTTRNPDKLLIAAALDAGRKVPGAVRSNGTPVLSVRTR